MNEHFGQPNTSQRSARTMKWRFLFLWLFPCLTKVTRAPFLSWMLTLLCARSHSLPLVSSGQGVIMAPYVTSLGVFNCALLVFLNSAHTFAGNTFIKLSSILPIELPSISCADPEWSCPYFFTLIYGWTKNHIHFCPANIAYWYSLSYTRCTNF